MKKYIAEFLGTFCLAFVVGLSLTGAFPVSTPILAGLVVLLFVYSIGHISGTHLNPAVTIGVFSIKKINQKDAISYIVAQVIGAGVAMFLISYVSVMHPYMSSLNISSSLMTGFAELLGTFFFTFGIASVIYGKTPSVMSGIVIGGSLLLGISISVLLGANGVLNPAVAFGIGSFGIMYILGPIIGSICGMQLYKYLSE